MRDLCFDRMPHLLAIEMRPGDDVWLLFDGERGPAMAGLASYVDNVLGPILSAEETLAAMQKLYPDPDDREWAHFYSSGKRLIRHPELPLVIRILYEPAGFNLLFLRSDA